MIEKITVNFSDGTSEEIVAQPPVEVPADPIVAADADVPVEAPVEAAPAPVDAPAE